MAAPFNAVGGLARQVFLLDTSDLSQEFIREIHVKEWQRRFSLLQGVRVVIEYKMLKITEDDAPKRNSYVKCF